MRSRGRFSLLLLAPGLAIVLTGCSLSALIPSTPNSPGEPTAPTAIPSQTPTTSATPTGEPTATPTNTPTPHPLSIEWLRWQQYPGSEIVIEDRLAAGPNYHRYLASYRSEGNKIFALLTVPFGEQPASGWPVVVFNHGYIPPEQYRTTERYVAYVNAFATNGYIVFRSDYRGHGNSEGVARGGYSSPDYTVDVLNALAAIRDYEQSDPDRIGMWGHSMGGYITLRSMVVSDEIKAGVIWAGVVASYPDLVESWSRLRAERRGVTVTPRARGWRSALGMVYGSPEENPVFWSSISANSYLEDLSGPVQLHHGTGDSSVPFEFSVWLEQQIEEAGGEVDYYQYPGDDHNLSGAFSTAMQRSVDFFDRNVK